MDCTDYVRQMTQKYQLGVAIAVIRNKPTNISTEQYIEQLKEKINTETDKTNKSFDDFNFDDNDFNFDDNDDSLIVNKYTLTTKTKELLNETENDNNLRINKTNEHLIRNAFHKAASINLQQDFNTTTQEIVRNNENVVNDIEVTILNEVRTEETNSLEDILRTLRSIDSNQAYLHNDNLNSVEENSQCIPSTSLNNLNEDITEENIFVGDDIPKNNFNFINIRTKSDTQTTVDEGIKAKIARNLNKNTKLYSSDVKIDSSSKNRHEDKNEIVVFKNTYDMEVDTALNEIFEAEEQINGTNTNFTDESTAVSINIANKLNKPSYEILKEQTVNFGKPNNEIGTNLVENETQDTIIYTLHGFTQNTSYISQSQFENIDIPQAFIHGNKNMPNVNNDNEKNIIEEKRTVNLAKETQNPKITTVHSSDIQYIIDNTGKTYAILKSIPLKDPNININNNNTNGIPPKDINSKNIAIININDNTNDTQTFKDINANNTKANTMKDNTHNKDTFESLDTDEYLDKDVEVSEEAIPFKVVKELSKIKAFLNKRHRKGSTDGFSSDSGYRSDSQNSFKSACLSEEWVPQSANCLYKYIIYCPLVAVTQDIVNEISQVLGRLIDRLHKEERYPSFLEELLDKIDSLLRDLSQDNDSFENILLDKDETIQRLLLLNKSTHVLKYSIEKIANVLNKVHSDLTSKENLYELTNINEVENLKYIFYLLEMFLQIYVKEKKSTQNTQISQETTKILKKSTISDIWKKKWNPDVKESKNVGSQEKSCVLSKCGEILNKIIVDCMDGYGLISFDALQCFNLLQG